MGQIVITPDDTEETIARKITEERDQLYMQILVQGQGTCWITYRQDMELEKNQIRNRIRYLERVLKWKAPGVMYHVLNSMDCCGFYRHIRRKLK